MLPLFDIKKSLLLLILVILTSCGREIPIKISPLHPYYTDQNEKGDKQRDVYFFVKNFKGNSGDYDSLISFANKYRRGDTSNSKHLSILFYTESKDINEKYRENESDLLAWHTKELVLFIGWDDQRLSVLQKFHDGKFLDTSNVKIIRIE